MLFINIVCLVPLFQISLKIADNNNFMVYNVFDVLATIP